MQDLLRIKASYDAIDALIQNRIGAALEAGDAGDEARWKNHQSQTDYAYFVVLFSHFERIVKAKFREALDIKRANPDWSQRRGWDSDYWNTDRLAFESQLAAVLDRRLPEYAQVLGFYRQRNHIAHGGLSPSVGSVDAFVAEIRTIVALLRA